MNLGGQKLLHMKLNFNCELNGKMFAFNDFQQIYFLNNPREGEFLRIYGYIFAFGVSFMFLLSMLNHIKNEGVITDHVGKVWNKLRLRLYQTQV